eukprot:TRINITY_DN9238_c0_g1_i2.p3 TRINITY_DN9238_c0_g1~~TRINITY_DN9238_c0_g1_i2.p3  ORF type:complete len:137 (-),score=11.28 TRINITY_DN9238_c0_g1_i2:323-733(-)
MCEVLTGGAAYDNLYEAFGAQNKICAVFCGQDETIKNEDITAVVHQQRFYYRQFLKELFKGQIFDIIEDQINNLLARVSLICSINSMSLEGAFRTSFEFEMYNFFYGLPSCNQTPVLAHHFAKKIHVKYFEIRASS